MSPFLAIPPAWLEEMQLDLARPLKTGRRQGTAMVWLAQRVCFTEGWNDLQRGQVRFAIRELAQSMGWSVGSASKFVARLQGEGELEVVDRNPSRSTVYRVGQSLASTVLNERTPKRTRGEHLAGSSSNAKVPTRAANDRSPRPPKLESLDRELNAELNAPIKDRTRLEVSTTEPPRHQGDESPSSSAPPEVVVAPTGAEATEGPSRGVDEVVAFWNQARDHVKTRRPQAHFPEARITPGRERRILAGVKRPGWWEEFQDGVRFVSASPFHHGLDPEKPWEGLSLDWLLKPENLTKCAERWRERATRPPGGPPPRGRPGPQPLESTFRAQLAARYGSTPGVTDGHRPVEAFDPTSLPVSPAGLEASGAGSPVPAVRDDLAELRARGEEVLRMLTRRRAGAAEG